MTAGDTSNSLPQDGKVTDRHLAKCLGVSVKTLREWLAEFDIPHIRFKTVAVIDMADFFERAPRGTSRRAKR